MNKSDYWDDIDERLEQEALLDTYKNGLGIF